MRQVEVDGFKKDFLYPPSSYCIRRDYDNAYEYFFQYCEDYEPKEAAPHVYKTIVSLQRTLFEELFKFFIKLSSIFQQ